MELKAKHISKRIPSRTEKLIEVRGFIESTARKYGFTEESIANIVLAVDEACTNIIKHAYRGATDKEIEISIYQVNRSFEIRIYDSGRTFDPSAVRQPVLKEHIGQLEHGGYGIFLMRQLMDKVEYYFNPGKRNEVRLIKYLAKP